MRFSKKMIIAQAIIIICIAGAEAATSIYAHYMPWFQTQGRSGNWTHWGDTIPRHTSHFTPLIGLYDSRDPDVLEYQVLEMKYAGIDGIMMDWYGINSGLPEYGTQPIFALLAKAGMKYAIVWEDRYANNQGGAAPVLQFMENNFFKTANYLKIGSRPLLMVWQMTFTTSAAWQTNMNSTTFQNKPILVTRDNPIAPPAEGAYSWINAAGGTAQALPSLDGFLGNSWTYMIPAALPRFVDDYSWGSYGTIDDTIDNQAGKMFVNTLTTCLESGLDLVQIATWNDWQEGTIIEPSVEYQYRDLEVIQTMRKKYIDTRFAFTPDNLRLPDRLLRERRQFRGIAKEIARLDSASNALFAGNPTLALAVLDKKTGVRSNVINASRLKAGSVTAVYDVLGRKIGGGSTLSKAKNQRHALNAGVYIIKNGDGSATASFHHQ